MWYMVEEEMRDATDAEKHLQGDNAGGKRMLVQERWPSPLRGITCRFKAMRRWPRHNARPIGVCFKGRRNQSKKHVIRPRG